MDSRVFLEPHFEGARFNDHALPLEMLKDLAELEKLFRETARWHYFRINPDRKRLPRGFVDKISLKLSSIEKGSAIPVIVSSINRDDELQTSMFSHAEQCYDLAKDSILNAINAAHRDGDAVNYLPDHILAGFDRIGRGLRNDEQISFLHNNLKCVLDRKTRRNLILSSPDREFISDRCTVKGTIASTDGKRRVFTIQISERHEVEAPIDPIFKTVIYDAAREFPKERVKISCIANIDRSGKVHSIDAIEEMQIIDKRDVESRIEDLKKLRDGWLNGGGVAPQRESLDWFIEWYYQSFSDDVAFPYIYPTLSGGLQLEWPFKIAEVHIEISLVEKTGVFSVFNNEEDEDPDDIELNLQLEDDVAEIVEKIKRVSNV